MNNNNNNNNNKITIQFVYHSMVSRQKLIVALNSPAAEIRNDENLVRGNP